MLLFVCHYALYHLYGYIYIFLKGVSQLVHALC